MRFFDLSAKERNRITGIWGILSVVLGVLLTVMRFPLSLFTLSVECYIAVLFIIVIVVAIVLDAQFI